jgi:uncharacterized membrane protein YidH (DUF202 family)
MIYQLVRLDWQRFWLATLIFGVVLGGLGFAILTRQQASTIPAAVLLNILLLALVAVARYRATPFQAALPIPARDLFMARLLPILAVIWIPLLAAVGAGYLAGARASSPRFQWLIAEGAVSTVGVLVLLSARLRELSAPRALINWFFLPYMLTGALVSVVWPGIVLAVCAATIAAWLWRDLAAMPKAFQVAPADAAAEQPARHRTRFARPVWWPVLRSMFARQPRAMLAYSVMFLLYPMASVIASLMLALFVFQGWVSMRWVWALPVSRRRILALGLLPLLALETAVQAAKPAGFIQAGEFVTVALLCTSCHLAIRSWKGLRAGAKFLVATGSIVCVCGPISLSLADVHYGKGIRSHYWRSYTAEYVAAHLVRFPPGILLILIAGTLIALGALYWLLQRQFETADFLPSTLTRLDTGEFSIGSGA